MHLKNERKNRLPELAFTALLLSSLIGSSAVVQNALAKTTDSTILEHGQFISTNNQMQQFSAVIPVSDKEQGKALTLTFMNGPDNLPAFSWVRVYLNDQTNSSALSVSANGQPTGRIIVNENSFRSTNKVDLSATGVMKPGGKYTILIRGAGLKGAALGWRLTTPPAGVMSVSSVSPTTPRTGGALTINGSGFAAAASDNTVYIDKFKATVTQAFPTSLQITVPPNVVPGKYSLTVVSKGTTSNAVPVKVLGMPELTRTDWLAGPCGQVVTIFGKNFSEDAAEDNVCFGGTKAKVTSATTETLTVVVPDFPELQGAPAYINPTPVDITLTVGTTPVKGHLSFTSTKVGWQQ